MLLPNAFCMLAPCRPCIKFGTVTDGAESGMKVDVGMDHKCLGSRPHPTRDGVVIPAHTCGSGYIAIRARAPAMMTAGEARQIFGGNTGKFSYECRAPLPLYYPPIK